MQKKFGNYTAEELIQEFSSPLYVYDEKTLRENCRKIQKLKVTENFFIHYAMKANSNVALLKIILEEGLGVETITDLEVCQAELAGFDKNNIFFSSNNITPEVLSWVIQKKLFVCLDSLCQLESYWKLGGKEAVCIRVNPALGTGHHQRVITAGKVKFGIDVEKIEEAWELAKKYQGKIRGLNIHIGSLFLEPSLFHQAAQDLLSLAENYPSLDYLDFGGGFGIAYQENEKDFSVDLYYPQFQNSLLEWCKKNQREMSFGIQPGRYIVGNAGVCLTKVQSKKKNRGIDFLGVDLGFNFLLRPEFYDAYHKIEHSSKPSTSQQKFTVVGNICEAGDVLGKDRNLPADTEIGDILMIRDTGAYGFSMASNYNSMARPAEVLITTEGKAKLIRKRESFYDLVRNQIF